MTSTDTLAWVAPDGTATPLTGQADLDVHWALGVTGRFMPPTSFVEDDVPQQAGTRLRNVRVLPRDVELPLTVIGVDELAVRTKLRQLLRLFDPTRGDGRLVSTSADGTVRELVCRYSDGMQGAESRDSFGRTFQRTVLVLRAFDPYWRDAAENRTTYTVGTIRTFLGNPFLNTSGKLTGDSILGSQTITNDGDLPAYPIFTVVGPATSFTLTNVTTGERIAYGAALAAGELLTIDTRPGVKSVLTGTGVNRYAQLSVDSSLFALGPGLTQLTLDLPGATAATYVTVDYRRRWLSP